MSNKRKQGQKLSIRMYVKVVITSGGLQAKKITKIICKTYKWHFRSYIILWKNCVFMILAFIQILWKNRVFMILGFIQIFIKIGRETKVRKWFWHNSGHIWPLMTSKVILYLIKDLRLHYVSIHRIFFFLSKSVHKRIY